MIQINLLPAEYRARAGTPAARFAAIVAGVVMVAAAGGMYAYTHFIELAKVREVKVARAEEAEGQDRRKKYSLDLQSEIEMFEKRRVAIQTINRSRTLWSKKLDQFFDVVTNQGGDESFKVWIEELEVPPQAMTAKKRTPAASKKGGAAPDGGQLKFSGFMAMESDADAPAHISAFHRALTGDPEATGRPTEFFADFVRINNPNVQIVQSRGKDDDRQPPVVASFKYELALVPKESAAGAKGAKPAKNANDAAESR